MVFETSGENAMEMRKTKLWKVLFVLFLLNQQAHTFTHWVVTENGRIEPKIDSPFYLRRPYDLLALLDQEKRRDDLNRLVDDLVKQKNRIDEKSTEATTYGEQMMNNKCADLFKVKDNYHLMIASNGSHRFDLRLFDYEDVKNAETEPHCVEHSKLDFSVFAYEHLKAMIERKRLAISPCPKLLWYLPGLEVEQLGQQIVYGLTRNSSSWVHYNLGLLYWWWRGDFNEAAECGRRALHYAPTEYRDIPQLNLGGLLQWAMQTDEAIILLQSAVHHNPLESKNHLSLANVYGHSKDFEKAMKCYKNFNRLQPLEKFDDKIMKKFVQCFLKLHNGFVEYHDTLQDILSDLHDYHGQQQKWLNMQQRLLWELAPFQFSLPFGNPNQLMKMQGGQNCMTQVNHDDKVITTNCEYSLDWPPSIQLDIKSNLQKTFKLYNDDDDNKDELKETMKQGRMKASTSSEEKHNKVVVDASKDDKTTPLLPVKYPTTMVTPNNLYFDATKWPTKDECAEWDLPLHEQENLELPVFIPPENKGYQIKKMLSDLIGVPEGKQHELPWYPPLCEHPEVEYDPFISPTIRQIMLKNKIVGSHTVLKNHFMKYVNDGKTDEAEIGQRIISAINKKSGPSWVLAVLASMYWRMRENTKNALECLNTPINSVPEEFDDVVLVSLGSMLQQLGLVENALKFASMAFKVNYLEPSTNFLLALIHYQKNNPILAMYYLKNVLRVDPDYYDGEAERLLKLWACRIKMGVFEETHSVEEKTEGVCADQDGFNGEGLLCSPNGEQCKTAAIQCFRADGVGDNGVKPLSEILSSQQCGTKRSIAAGSILSSLLSSDPESRQVLSQRPPPDFHMRILFGDEYTPSGSVTIGDFYVSVFVSDDPSAEVMLNLYDKSGTYQLSRAKCREIKDAEWLHFTSMWQSIAARNINIGPFLNPLPKKSDVYSEPHCSDAISPSSATLDHLTAMVLRKRLPHVPESSLSEWLGLLAGDQRASIRELGAKIGIALQENTTSWILATAAALYWRVVGNTEEAVTCLRQALTYVPSDMKDIPLINLANVLHRVGFLGDALEVAYIALESHPNYVVNQFTVGNIHTALGDLEKAVFFYRSSLALDPNFEPARERLKAILCTLFDESFRDETEILGN